MNIKDDLDQLIEASQRELEKEDQAELEGWSASKRWRDELRPWLDELEGSPHASYLRIDIERNIAGIYAVISCGERDFDPAHEPDRQLHRGEKWQLSPFGRTRGFKPCVRFNLIYPLN